MCPLAAANAAWVLLALSALGLLWQARRYRVASRAARFALAAWAAWLAALAWAVRAGVAGTAPWAGPLALTALPLLLLTAWVVHRDWRAATQARRAAEAAIDRRMQAELERLFATPPDEEARTP